MWEGEEGEKCVFAHQALFWPGGNGATVTLESASQGQGKQEHKQKTGAQRECARKKEGKWEME